MTATKTNSTTGQQQQQPIDAGFLPIFAGQGTSGFDVPLHKLAPPSSLAEVCLKELHSTVVDCFKSLSAQQLNKLQLARDHFDRPETLLGTQGSRILSPSSALAASLRTTAFQLVLYLAKVESAQVSFEDHLGPATKTIGVLGFSSGLISATVVASSRTTLDYLTNSVAAIKVAFWLGLRADLFKRDAVAAIGDKTDQQYAEASWSTVVLNADEVALQHELDHFAQAQHGSLAPRITANLGPDSFTVSGRPDLLAKFSKSVSSHGWSCFTPTVLSLYHGGEDTKSVHDAILQDLKDNGVVFPALNTLKLPICSTKEVKPIQTGSQDSEFLHDLISLIVTDPTDWAGISARLANLDEVRMLNIGPGAGLFRPLTSSVPGDHVDGLSYIQDNFVRASVHDRPSPCDIAITGMNFKLPGAGDMETFWANLTAGLNMCSPIPGSRFNVQEFPCKTNNSNMHASTGNFIDAPDSFDNAFFNISSREAKSMDPQQRLLLQAAWLALEDAGYVPNVTPSFNPAKMGVYVGVATNDYERNLSDSIDVYYSTGTLRAFLSGRISHALKLSGPSIVLDTACSGSLTAFHLACQAITTGECTSVIAGGVNVISSPEMFVGLDRAHFLSPTGQCKPWDADADGYSRAEGVACFVLKPLHAAIRENDSIYGVIRATGLNQNGNSKSITQPHADTQAVLLRSLLVKSGIDKEQISYVEAHGTGTQTGDPMEMTSIRSVVGRNDSANKFHVGSVKAVVGHAEAASGSAGLAKILAMLHHRTIPKQPLLNKLNPKVDPLEVDGCNIALDNIAWELGPGQPTRVALLNNFGAAGANGALIISEAPTPSRTILQSRASKRNSWMLAVSGKTESALEAARQGLVQALKKRDDITLGDLSYTLMARRPHYSHRLAVIADNKEDAIVKLGGARVSKATQSDMRCLALFSGQGSQHQGMGRELLYIPAFAATVQRCKTILKANGAKATLSWLSSEQSENEFGENLVDAIVDMQCSIFVLDLALYWLFRQWGVEAHVLGGHSLGEYVALTVAGVLSLEDALFLVVERARLMATLCPRDTTGMIAVSLGVDEVEEVLSRNPAWDLSPACINSHSDTVLSGPIENLHELKSFLDQNTKVRSTVLSVPFGYHSKAMAPIKDDFLQAGAKVQFNAPSIPIISNVHGRVVQPGESGVFDIKYLYRHIEEPVKFCPGLEDAFASFAPTICLDFGAHPACLPMATAVWSSSNSDGSKTSIPSLKPAFLSTLKKKLSSWAALLPTLETLYASDVDLNWNNFFAGEQVRCLNRLPSYAFADTRYWVDYTSKGPTAAGKETALQSDAASSGTGYIMLDECVELPTTRDGGQAIFTTPVEQLEVFISGHAVGGQPLCPASVYHELALAAIQYTTENADCAKVLGDKVFRLGQVEYQRPFVLTDATRGNTFKTILTLSAKGDQDAVFEVHSQGAKESTCHCRGTIGEKDATEMASRLQRSSRFMLEQLRRLRNGSGESETFKTKTIYERIFPRVVRYSSPYWSIQSMSMSLSGKEAVARVKLPAKDNAAKGKFVVEPRFMDTILHATGFLINSQAPDDIAYICSKTDKVKILYRDSIDGKTQTLQELEECDIFCVIESLKEEGVELGTAYVEQNGRIVATLTGMHFKAIPLPRLHMLLGAANVSRAALPSQQTSAAVPPSAGATKMPTKTTCLKKPNDPLADSTSEVADRLRQLISDTCGTPMAEVQDSVETASLGIDSLMVIELVAKVSQEWPSVRLEFSDFLDAKVSDITRLITGQLPEVEEEPPSRPRMDSVSRTVSFKQALDAFAIETVGVEDRLRTLISETCGAPVSQIQNSTETAALGIDSLMVIELVTKISQEWPSVILEFTDFLDAHVGDIIDLVKNQLSPEVDTASESQPDDVFSESSQDYLDTPLETPCYTPRQSVSSTNLEKINEEASKHNVVADPALIQRAPAGRSVEAPLFLIHDGSGCWAPYTRLGSLQREVWAFSNPRDDPWPHGLPEMAACYASQILKLGNGKPVVVGGWSFGGVVAFEVARQLMKNGQEVKACIMIDSPYPIGHQGLSNSVIESIAPAPSKGRMNIQRQFEMNTRALVAYGQTLDDKLPQAPGLQIIYLRSSMGFDCNLSWLRDRDEPSVANVEDWRPLVGPDAKLSQYAIPGNHFEALDSTHAAIVTEQLRQA
ncbi:unnamed protein product [Tilletia laevis]|uniref:Polyketide synthase n=3 Tax=Tilletia TaxID=13289 RepID=A0A8X7MSF9_9BASI|nr:hypothetical protein CF336_g3517 [Tilletia laevis]KAE8199510.1 hypothetical protein CF328_g3227 [Tilletia controversa]KAE8262086.1 hypothetical protein A4X03_0g2729 [Tilletia caries]KAE8204207.1 hypothetical protein CF335_g2740 [Tilletia laevis]KAE8247310.1 hypothetical protein A4X06_0g4545 [Tilletia controversa]